MEIDEAFGVSCIPMDTGWVKELLRVDKPIECYTAREVGTFGEDVACGYLEQQGLEVSERNWRCPFGEVDAVCIDHDETTLLVEVKTRIRARGAVQGDAPETAVGPSKRRRYRDLALCYIGRHPHLRSVRFDVVGVTVAADRNVYVRHIENAYQWDDEPWAR